MASATLYQTKPFEFKNYPISSTHLNRVYRKAKSTLFQIQRVAMHIIRWSMKSTSYRFGQIQLCADFKRKTLMIPFPQTLFLCVKKGFSIRFPLFENFQNSHVIIFSATEFAVSFGRQKNSSGNFSSWSAFYTFASKYNAGKIFFATFLNQALSVAKM